MEIVQLLEAGEVPETVRVILEKIENTEVFRIVKREVNAVLAEYPEEYEAVKHILTRVTATLKHDADIVYKRIMETPAVQRIFAYVMQYINSVGIFWHVKTIIQLSFLAMKYMYSKKNIEVM